jgi:hypothetical protein
MYSHQHPIRLYHVSIRPTSYVILFRIIKKLKWFILLIWHLFKILFSPLCFTWRDEQNHISPVYFLSKLTHHYFKSLPSICTSWIDRVYFLYFSVQLMSSPPFPSLGTTSHSVYVVMLSCRFTLPFHWVKTSLLSSLHLLTMFCPVASPSQAKIEALNPYHRHRLSSSDRPTLTLHCYKKIISTLVSLFIT